MVRTECSMSMNMPSMPAILTIMATSLLTKNLHDMTEQISPLRMRSLQGLETVNLFASPLVAGATVLPLPCMVNVFDV